jgi:predicted dinucleotide-binding enzyme
MATSISKLAIMLTADTSGLTSGLTRAQAVIKGFGTNLTAGGANNFIGMFSRGAGLAAVIGLSTAALYRFLSLGIREGNAFEQQMAGVNGNVSKLKESFTGLAVTLTGPLRRALNTIGESFTDVFDMALKDRDIVSIFGAGKSGAEMRKALEAQKAGMDAAKKAAEENAKAVLKAAEAHQKWIETMKDKGADITASLRTPVEIFADTIAELRELVGKGFIDPETFGRGMARAKADLLDATKIAKEFKSALDGRVAAVERFSMAGFSAVNSGRDQLVKMLDEQKKQLAEEKKQTALLDEANHLTRTRKPITITRNRL